MEVLAGTRLVAVVVEAAGIPFVVVDSILVADCKTSLSASEECALVGVETHYVC